MTDIGAIHPMPNYPADQVVTSGEVRELGRLIRIVSEALQVEPGTLMIDEIGAHVRSLMAENQQRGVDRARVARERNALSGLLRGMARRSTELRRKYRSLSRSYVRLGSERDEKQFEVERLRRWIDRFRERSVTRQSQLDEASPQEAVVENAVANALTDAYGFVPLNVRYGAARAAREVVEQWRNPAEPNPWFTKPAAEFPIEQHEQADRERVETVRKLVEVPMISEVAREQIKSALTNAGKDMRELFLNGQWDKETPLASEAIDAPTEKVVPRATAPGCEFHFRGACRNCGGTAPTEQDIISCPHAHVPGVRCDGCGWWIV